MGTEDFGEVRRLVGERLPGYRAENVVRLGEGQENVAFEVDGELIVRFSKEPDVSERARLVENEARLLTAVAGVSPLPVPEPVFTAPELGCLAYFAIQGTPLLRLPQSERLARAEPLARTLRELLAALHAVPAGRMTGLVDVDDPPASEWLSDAVECHAAVAGLVPSSLRGAVESFLAAPPPDGAYDPVFSHNDLGMEHVIVDPATWTVTGVIDWGDAAIDDPAYDHGLLFRDLGPVTLRGESDALRERAVFYARCTVLEDLAYGVETGLRLFVDRSVAAMEWVFADR